MHGGLLIRQLRLRAGLTQRQLAVRLGTEQSVVARWESRATSPTVETVSRVGSACGLSLDWSVRAIDPDLDRVLHEQLRRTPMQRVRSVAALAAMPRA